MNGLSNLRIFYNKIIFEFINKKKNEFKFFKKKKFKIIILVFFIYTIFNNIQTNEKFYFNSNKYKRYFNNILPKKDLKNKTFYSLDEIFNSKILFINDENLTREYIKYIRPVNETEEEKYNKKYSESETKISPEIFNKKKDQYNYLDFAKLCLEEKLIYSNKIEYNNKPIISIILPSYNKEEILLKSIRSIQNQSFKNIEIIIVNDCSTDNSIKIFQQLLETDPRIRIFNHLKNMGCWRSRLDGILYSKGKYIILFDVGDLYEDNYVIEDAYNIIEKYNLDSTKFLFRIVNSYHKLNESDVLFHVNENSKIIYGYSNIEAFNKYIFKSYGNIWTRISRSNILIKGIYLLNDYVLNLYKNVWDDIWFNTIIHRVSYSFLVCERIVYIYLGNGKGVGRPKIDSDKNRDKYIQELLGFLYFNYNMLPQNDNKKEIIKILKEYDSDKNLIKLSFLKSNFYILNNLINILIKDPFVFNSDKIYLKKILKKYKQR